ncbi:hypothetical protein [Ralstonia solanacearum]|uniref:hypothetical protein n=1 Tax=Ralstonia solanacearum TaxID=305 RepID=UPI0018D12752|nr:hypothetical protein [Ralstonia solanacearum]
MQHEVDPQQRASLGCGGSKWRQFPLTTPSISKRMWYAFNALGADAKLRELDPGAAGFGDDSQQILTY